MLRSRAILLAILLILSAAGLYGSGQSGTYLMVTAPREGNRICYTVPVKPGDKFTLTYTHSVSNSEVQGTFALTEDQAIRPLTTTFGTFGPGLPVTGGVEPTTIENGLMTVLHQEEPREEIRLWVSPLTGETITVGDRVLDLAGLSDEPMLLEITLKRVGMFKRILNR